MADLDLAGIITRTCANLRLRFSKVAVLRILTSGTKSATVTVDGVKYDLYAPTPPTASTTAPLMDGTASYGSGTSYARSNHVHPTDTSLVPKSATNSGQTTQVTNDGGSVHLTSEKSANYADVQIGRNGNASVSLYAETTGSNAELIVTPTGVSIDKLATPTTSTMPTTKQYVDDGLASKQAALVSGTNIKTVNSTSLLGSGDISVQPTLVSGTNIKTVGGTSLLGSGDIPITITMEDTDVDAAVEEAWPGYSVTISLTRPLYGENFNKCQIEGYADGGNITDILGLIIDPAGSMTVEFDSDTYEYLSLMFDARWGASFMESNITCTGGVSYYTETDMTNRLFVVTGSGTITINGIDYDD